MSVLLPRLRHAATLRNTLLAAVIWLAFAAGVMPLAQAEIERTAPGPSILDLRFAYSPAEAYATLDGLGHAGRRMYALAEATADVFYPLATAFFFALLLARLQRRTHRPAWLPLWPFVTLLIDFLENTALITLLLNYPQKMTALAQLASALTTLKWVSVGVTVVAILALVVAWFVKGKTRKLSEARQS